MIWSTPDVSDVLASISCICSYVDLEYRQRDAEDRGRRVLASSDERKIQILFLVSFLIHVISLCGGSFSSLVSLVL